MDAILYYLLLYLEMGVVYMAINMLAVYYLAVRKTDRFDEYYQYLCRRQGIPLSSGIGWLLLYKIVLWPRCAWHVWANLLKDYRKTWR